MRVLATAFLVSILLPVVTRADFVYEAFDYRIGASRPEPLVQKSGGTGFASGWSGGAIQTGTHHDYNTTPGSLEFGDLAVGGNSVETSATYGHINGIVRTTLQNFVGSGIGPRFLSFLIRRDSELGDYGGFGGLYIDGTVSELFVGLGGTFDTWGMEQRGNNSAALADKSSVLAEVGKTALLVLKMESFDLGAERFTLYVNPTPGQGEPGFGLLKSDLDIGTANQIALYNSGDFTFDEIRIGDSFAAVTPIASTPEPSTIVLSILGLSPVLAARMRKRFFKGRK